MISLHGIEKKLKDILPLIKGVKEAYIFGSYASNKMDSFSDIDILVIGSHSELELYRHVTEVQKETNRELNVVDLSPEEFEQKKKDKNPFIQHVLKHKTIKLV